MTYWDLTPPKIVNSRESTTEEKGKKGSQRKANRIIES